jgi:hypothetical protein
VDAAVWGFIGVVVGGIVAGGLTLLGDKFRADRDAKLDSAKRQDDRLIHLDEIQRLNLLELQVALADWMAAEDKFGYHDLMSLRKHGGVDQGPAELREELRTTGRRLSYLTERVKDDQLRQSVLELQIRSARRAAELNADKGIAEADVLRTLDAQGGAYAAVSTRIGEVLRRYL